MNPLSRLWVWLRGLFGTREAEPEEWTEDELSVHYFGVLGMFMEQSSPIVEIADYPSLAYYPVRVVAVSAEFVVFYVLDKDGAETGERRVRILDSIQDVRLDSRVLQLIRLKRMMFCEPPPEETDAQDQDDSDASGLE